MKTISVSVIVERDGVSYSASSCGKYFYVFSRGEWFQFGFPHNAFNHLVNLKSAKVYTGKFKIKAQVITP